MKVLKQSSYPIAFLIAAVGVLALGIGSRTYKAPRPLSESNLTLQPTLQAPRLNELPQYVTDSAADAARQLLFLNTAPHSAVMWDANHAVTGVDLTRPKSAVILNPEGKEVALSPVTISSDVPLEYWAVPAEVAVGPAVAAQAGTSQGAWVIAVGRATKDHVIFAEGLFQGVAPAHCQDFDYDQVNTSALLSNALLGGGLFTLSGDLLGVIVACAGEPVVVSVDSVNKGLRRPVFITDHLQRDFGMSIAESKPQAVLITTVWTGRPASVAGICAGDVLVEADGQPVHLLADLDILEKGDAPAVHTLILNRGGRRVQTTLSTLAKPPEPDHSASVNGLSLISDPMNGRILVESVATESSWAKSGLQAGDVLDRVEGVPVRSVVHALEALNRQGRSAVKINVERGAAEAELIVSRNVPLNKPHE